MSGKVPKIQGRDQMSVETQGRSVPAGQLTKIFFDLPVKQFRLCRSSNPQREPSSIANSISVEGSFKVKERKEKKRKGWV